MSILVESLKRLYAAQRITDEQLQKLQADGKINQDELEYIKKQQSL